MERSRRAFPVSVILLLFLRATMQIDNAALKGVAIQSSQWTNSVAQLAIDGNRDANFADGSCSSTSEETSPWWRVDLLGQYRVTAVSVTNRRDCCSRRIDGAEIHIGNSLKNHGIDNPRCAVISDIPAGQTYTFQCNEMEGRYVVLVIPGQTTALTLCEVAVYGYLVTTQQVVRLKLAQKDQNMNLTDPVLQEAILQQIKTQLTKNGMSDHVTVRWKEQPDGKIFQEDEKSKKNKGQCQV